MNFLYMTGSAASRLASHIARNFLFFPLTFYFFIANFSPRLPAESAVPFQLGKYFFSVHKKRQSFRARRNVLYKELHKIIFFFRQHFKKISRNARNFFSDALISSLFISPVETAKSRKTRSRR